MVPLWLIRFLPVQNSPFGFYIDFACYCSLMLWRSPLFDCMSRWPNAKSLSKPGRYFSPSHGATKRELFEAGQAAGVPGGGITVGLWMQILTQLDHEGAFKNG
jgi:hypothetical protein